MPDDTLTETTAPAPRRAATIRLQERDLDMLASLGVARYLTVQALEWLHFPAWRARWARHQAEEKVYYPIPNLYRRLEGLRGGGYVVAVRRSVERASVNFGRLADIYTLTDAGAELLATHRGLDLADLVVGGTRARSLTNLEHTVAIALLYAALRAELAHDAQTATAPVTLTDWMDDRTLSLADPDQPTRRRYDKVRVGNTDLPVLPDAACQLARGERAIRYFVEVDRGTRPLDTWREKARAYAAYSGSAALQARYEVATFGLLVTAPTQRRLERIAGWIAKVDANLCARTRFLVQAQVHPTTIRTAWHKVTTTQLQQRVVAGRVTEQAEVTLGATTLWNAETT